MKKVTTTLGIVAVVAVAYVGGSWYVGKKAQTAIAHTVAQTNARFVKMLGPDLSSTRLNVEIREYQRGVFSSKVRYVIHTLDSAGKPMEYQMLDDLQHGPFPLAALREGDFKPMLAFSQAEMVVTPSIQKWFDLKQGQSPFHVETQIGFGGQGVSKWTLEPFETAAENGRVSFSGGDVRIVFSDGFNNNVATGHFDKYAMTDTISGEKLELRDIHLDSTTKTREAGQFDHHSSAHVTSLSVTGGAESSPAVIKDLSVDLSSTQNINLLEAQLHYNFAQVLIADKDLGQMKLGVSLNDFDIDALSALQVAYAEIEQKRGPGAEAGFELTDQEQAVLQEKLRPILAAGPSFSIDSATWTNAAGQGSASAVVKLRDPGEIKDMDAEELTRELVAQANLDLSVSRPMVVHLFQQVGMGDDADPTLAGELGGQFFDEYAELLTQAGLMTRQDDTLLLSLQASPAEDSVILNDETVTIEQLMMLGLGLMLLQ